jgi:hypothetical protein
MISAPAAAAPTGYSSEMKDLVDRNTAAELLANEVLTLKHSLLELGR